MATLNTLVKPQKKRQRQTPLYFKTRKSTKIKKGKPQTPTKAPITIEESPSKKEEVDSTERKVK